MTRNGFPETYEELIEQIRLSIHDDRMTDSEKVISVKTSIQQFKIEDLIDADVAAEVLFDLNGVTEDGLTRDMQNMLTFLLTKGKRVKADGEVVYQASVNTVATGIGKSRDSKAIALRVEPYLIEQGYLQVGHGGRNLTDAGVKRAEELIA